MADVYLTVKQAADELRTSERTVRRWLTSGKLVGRKVDRGKLGLEWRVDANSLRTVAADLDGGQARRPKPTDTTADTSAEVIAVLTGEVRSLREENAEYRQVIEQLAVQVSGLRHEVAAVQKLLLPAPQEVPAATARTRFAAWWGRLTRRDP